MPSVPFPNHDFYAKNTFSPEAGFKFKLGSILGIVSGVAIAGGLVFGTWYLIKLNSGKNFISPLGSIDKVLSKYKAPAKNIQNPITGELFTEVESVAWKDTRPLGVMVNNHPDARPQFGLDKADIVYEIVAEGGITRFLAFFLSQSPEKVGPVRSTREYYLILVKELGDAMLMHIGWSPQALEAIETWPVRSLGRGGAPFWRDNPRNVAVEHTAYANANELRTTGTELGWEGKRDFDSWKFKDSVNKYPDVPAASKVLIDFWYPGDFTAMFTYKLETNTYLRFMGYDENDELIPHIDDGTKAQLEVKNLIVQFASEETILNDEKNRLTYQLIGSGNALIFLDGKVIKSTWSKSERDGRTKFYDLNGSEVEFNRGKFWVSIVPDRNEEQVVYE